MFYISFWYCVALSGSLSLFRVIDILNWCQTILLHKPCAELVLLLSFPNLRIIVSCVLYIYFFSSEKNQEVFEFVLKLMVQSQFNWHVCLVEWLKEC